MDGVKMLDIAEFKNKILVPQIKVLADASFAEMEKAIQKRIRKQLKKRK